MIKNFEVSTYLDIYPDIQEAITNEEFSSFEEYMRVEGLREIENGLRKFHKDFEPFDQELYLENDSKIKEAIEKGKFFSAFMHFSRHGYEEIISGRRVWPGIRERTLKALLTSFDRDAYFSANPDIEEALKNKKFHSLEEYMRVEGLREIEKGLRKFHKDFEPFNQELYLENDSKIKEAVEKGKFFSAFMHFSRHGYEEIISGRRVWSKRKEQNLDTLHLKVIKNHKGIFQCKIEEIDKSGIKGWIFEIGKDLKEKNLELFFIFDREEMIHTVNDIAREDVKKVYQLEYNTGFSIDIPKDFLDGKRHSVQIMVKKEGDYYFLEEREFLLLEKEQTFIEKKEESIPQQKVAKRIENKVLVFEGFEIVTNHSKLFKYNVEKIGESGVRGWVYDLNDTSYGNQLTLKLVIDNIEISEEKNSIVRKDIQKAFDVECSSGFLFEMPFEYLDGENHTLKLFVVKDKKCYLIKESIFHEKSIWLNQNQEAKHTILFCTHNLRSQGAQNSLFEMAIGLKRLFGIVPVVYSPGDGPLRAKYEDHNIQVIIDNTFDSKVTEIEDFTKQIEMFGKKIHRLGCQTVIANTLLSFYMVHAANKVNVPTIFIPRESETPREYFNYLAPALKIEAERTFQIASQVVFVAKATKVLWDFLDKEHSFKVIHNSLNQFILNRDAISSRREIRKSFGIEEDEIVLLSLGTVTPRKGQIDFVKALPEIFHNTTKKIKVFIVGMDIDKNGILETYSQEIYDIIEEYPDEIKRKIYMLPATDRQIHTKPYDFYALADIYAFTSRIESFPRVILEAMYFGLPIVATPCFGVIEQCIENYNAFYYEEENIEQLSENILKLVEDDTLRMSFSQGSKRLFSNLQTYDQMLRNYYDVVKSITKKDT